jgi:hypothetical protein
VTRGPVVRALALFVVASAAAAGTGACGESTPTGGTGDTLIDDTRPEPRPPQNPDEGVDAAVDAAGEASIYPGITACDTCSCSSDQYYCFGGATARARQLASDAGSGEAGACPVPGAGADGGGGGDPGLSPSVGCNLLPKGCTDCACVIAALQPKYSCYLVCADNGQQFSVYCPHP